MHSVCKCWYIFNWLVYLTFSSSIYKPKSGMHIFQFWLLTSILNQLTLSSLFKSVRLSLLCVVLRMTEAQLTSPAQSCICQTACRPLRALLCWKWSGVNLSADAAAPCWVLQLLTWRGPGWQVQQVGCSQEEPAVSPAQSTVQLRKCSWSCSVLYCLCILGREETVTHLAVMVKLDETAISVPLKHKRDMVLNSINIMHWKKNILY